MTRSCHFSPSGPPRQVWAAHERARTRRRDRLGVRVTPGEIQAHLRGRYDFAQPVPVEVLLADVEEQLSKWTEHATNPLHFGLFRPAPDPLCVVADALAAMHDPNLATWDFAPAANEIEPFVLAALASRFGCPPAKDCTISPRAGRRRTTPR